jgi:hypothetical protein
MEKGIGYVAAQLVASAVLTSVPIWTLDQKPAQVMGGQALALESAISFSLRFPAGRFFSLTKFLKYSNRPFQIVD